MVYATPEVNSLTLPTTQGCAILPDLRVDATRPRTKIVDELAYHQGLDEAVSSGVLIQGDVIKYGGLHDPGFLGLDGD